MYIIINYVQKFGCDLERPQGKSKKPRTGSNGAQRDEGYRNSEKREWWRTGHLRRSSGFPPAQVDLTGREPGEQATSESLFSHFLVYIGHGFPGGSVGENLPANAGAARAIDLLLLDILHSY